MSQTYQYYSPITLLKMGIFSNKWLIYQTLHGLIIGLIHHPGGSSCWKTSSMNPFSLTKLKWMEYSVSELSQFFLINYKII